MNRLPQQQAMADALRAREVAQTGAPSQYMGMSGVNPQDPSLGGAGGPPGQLPAQAAAQSRGQGLGMNTMGVAPGTGQQPGMNPSHLQRPDNTQAGRG